MKKTTKTLGVRIDADLAERAMRQADAEHRNISQVVRMLLESWLKKAKRAA